MTDDPLSPAWIASRLTPAQRAALIWLPGDGSERGANRVPRYGVNALTAVEVDPDIFAYLARAETRQSLWFYRATPLGLRVRAVVAGGVDG